MHYRDDPDLTDPSWLFRGRGRTRRVLVLSQADRKVFQRAASLAARIRESLGEEDTERDYELARLEHGNGDMSNIETMGVTNEH